MEETITPFPLLDNTSVSLSTAAAMIIGADPLSSHISSSGSAGFVSPGGSSSNNGGVSSGASSGDWITGSDQTIVTDNRHIVIPLMSFVFGFPVLVITVLCVIQQRNKWLYERHHMRMAQQRRFSTASTIFTGYPSTTRATTSNWNPKDLAAARNSIIYNESPVLYTARRSSDLVHMNQNGNCVLPSPSPSGERQVVRKMSAIRFSDVNDVDDEESDRSAIKINNAQIRRSSAIYLHPSYAANGSAGSRSPLLNVGPQNILDKFGYVDS